MNAVLTHGRKAGSTKAFWNVASWITLNGHLAAQAATLSLALRQVLPSVDFAPVHNGVATFFFGAPASGKSATLTPYENEGIQVIDVDAIKKELGMQEGEDPSPYHEASKVIGALRHKKALERSASFVVDGCGGSMHKMEGFILEARARGFRVEVILVWCHEALNFRRNLDRKRTVPHVVVEEALRDVPPSWAACHTLAHSWRSVCTNPGGDPSWAPCGPLPAGFGRAPRPEAPKAKRPSLVARLLARLLGALCAPDPSFDPSEYLSPEAPLFSSDHE